MTYKIRYVETISHIVEIEALNAVDAEEQLNTILEDDACYAIDNGIIEDDYDANWFTEVVE